MTLYAHPLRAALLRAGLRICDRRLAAPQPSCYAVPREDVVDILVLVEALLH